MIRNAFCFLTTTKIDIYSIPNNRLLKKSQKISLMDKKDVVKMLISKF
jgi:hypothetical protein